MNQKNDVQLKLLEITWANIQHHEKLRTNLFNIYLVMVGSYFFILKIQGDKFHYAKLGLFAAFTILCVGFLFIWSVNHFRSLIARDIKVIRRIYKQLYNQNDVVKEIMTDFEKYYDTASTKSHTALFAMGNILIYTTAVISSSVLTAAIWLYFQPSALYIMNTFIGVLLLHIAVSWVIWNYAVVRYNL
jgi:hypothetical protein